MDESLSSEALFQFWLPDLVNSRKFKTVDIGNWLQAGAFQSYSYPTDASRFSINYLPESLPLQCFAHDFSKFSTVAIETFESVNRNLPKHITKGNGWLLIQMYYSAFFAAHALLRLTGRSCSLLETSSANKINEILGVFHSTPPRVSGGYYSVSLETLGRTINFEKTNLRPHHLLWKEFSQLLARIIHVLAGGSARYQAVLLQLQTLQTVIKSENSFDGTWLSNVRHDVNYRLKHNVWFPYNKTSNSSVEELRLICKSWSVDPLLIGISTNQRQTLQRFLSACTFIVSLCRDVVLSMHNRLGPDSLLSSNAVKLIFLAKAP